MSSNQAVHIFGVLPQEVNGALIDSVDNWRNTKHFTTDTIQSEVWHTDIPDLDCFLGPTKWAKRPVPVKVKSSAHLSASAFKDRALRGLSRASSKLKRGEKLAIYFAGHSIECDQSGWNVEENGKLAGFCLGTTQDGRGQVHSIFISADEIYFALTFGIKIAGEIEIILGTCHPVSWVSSITELECLLKKESTMVTTGEPMEITLWARMSDDVDCSCGEDTDLVEHFDRERLYEELTRKHGAVRTVGGMVPKSKFRAYCLNVLYERRARFESKFEELQSAEDVQKAWGSLCSARRAFEGSHLNA
ncbi:hypothetical protein BJ508DRAFT_329931 [Ascobolus immersus RN42]|uniref:Uncharacterized protein n=1 Tax=Ascobolus immersus RN42 TaxID=1160509 RepID=A0A3N4HVU0_ASCIM|nr:hypothetical protein BJ508DRAFT_329931 [Ascobolus immersus RN42]